MTGSEQSNGLTTNRKQPALVGLVGATGFHRTITKIDRRNAYSANQTTKQEEEVCKKNTVRV